MKGKGAKTAAGIFIGCAFFALLAVWLYGRSASFMEMAGETAAAKATEILGVPVEIGTISMESSHSLVIKDIAVYDKQAECIARVEEARVGFRLLSVFSGDPAAAVDEVVLRQVNARLSQREDGTWNAEDIVSEEGGENTFRGKVRVEEGTLVGRAEGKEVLLENLSVGLDMGSYPVMKAEAEADVRGAKLRAEGTVSDERKIVTAKVEDVDLEQYLPLVPDGVIPENVRILSGEIPKAKVAILQQYGELSFSGQAEYKRGSVQVEQTKIEDIHGFATFTDSELMLFTDAKAAEQKAHIHGKLRWDTGAPFMDLHAESEAFDPGAVLPTIPFHGPVSFQAHVTGSFTNPAVDGEFRVPFGEAEGIAIRQGKARVHFADNILHLQDVSAGVFDGTVEGEGELRLDDMSYVAHLKAENLEAAHLSEYVPEVSGRVSADLGLSGRGEDLGNLEVYGSAGARNAFYGEVPVRDLSVSFYAKGKDVTVDYLSLQAGKSSNIGIEGQLRDGNELEFSFYGWHVEMDLLSKLVPQADITGWGDFQGRIKGNVENPRIGVKLSCIKGTLFKQPFDTLQTTMGGSLDGVGIRNFLMEKDGREVWQVHGYAGFVGEKRVDLHVDTVGARMEDIAALVAPDQPITGNVDNTIHITGTLEDPHAVGYIHMYRGSYRGMLVIGVDGDYFLEGDKVRLQDARIKTPFIDMDVSGTLDRKTQEMDMVLSVYDIDMKRLEHRFPYGVSGHGTFSGNLRGSLSSPVFKGTLESEEIILNEQVISKIYGQVEYGNNMVSFREFGFTQGEGAYQLNSGLNLSDESIFGRVSVKSADINALASILNQKTDQIQGTLDAEAVLGGTLDNPSVYVKGSIPAAKIAGHDVHDLALAMNLANRVMTVEKLEGFQGASGYFQAVATASMEGPLQGRLSARDLEAGLFTELAKLDAKAVGMTDMEAQFGGTLQNPSAEISLAVRKGGVDTATFDDMKGEFALKNGLIDVRQLVVEKTMVDQHYQASAKGIVPLKAIFAESDEEVNDYEQIKLNLTLDQADLSLLPLFSDHIDWAIGATQGNIEIAGTLSHPLIYGNIAVPEGSVKFKELDVPITDMRLDLKFNGTSIKQEEFSGRMGNGSYRMKGAVVLDGRSLSKYDLQLSMDSLDVQSSFYRGPLSGEFRVEEGEIEPLPGRKVICPKIIGNLQLENCRVSLPSVPEAEGEMPNILLDVSVNLGKKVRFYSSHLYDMYLEGSAHFGGSTRYPKTSGTISVKRGGTFTYLSTVFNIRNGELQFNQVDSFMPSISFFADTRLAQAKIFLWAAGPLGSDKMKLRLASSPQMSQTEIVNLLTFRSNVNNKGKNEMGGLLLTGLQMSILSGLEDAVREVLYLDVFSISQGSGSTFSRKEDDKDYYSLTIGKYVSDKVLFKYTQGFGNGSDKYRFGVTYELTDRIGLTYEREGKENIVGVEARIKF